MTGDIRVTGTVVNSVTGEPIPRAMVQMNGVVQRAVLTDAEGKFQFDGLPETQAMFVARKPGYFSDLELQRAARMKPTPITAGMGSLTVKLVPSGVVSGHITTAGGEPVEAAGVRLKMRTIQNGRKQWTDRNGTSTDEDGAFRIANLQPGTYYLYTDGGGRMLPSTEEAFSPAYYPGVNDISGASPIEVRPGQTIVADITVRKEKAYRISGVVTGLQPGLSANLQLLASGGDYVPSPSMVTPAGAFEIRRVPAGTYTLKVIAQQRGGPGFVGGFGQGMPRMPQSYTGSMQLTVSDDVTGISIPIQASANIPVNVRTEFNNSSQTDTGVTFMTNGRNQRQVRQYVNLRLVRSDGRPGDGFAQPDENGGLTIHNLEPGRYRTEFNAMGGNTYVQSATYGNTDLLHDELVVSSGGELQPIEVVVRDDAASVSGTARCDDEQCWVLIVPDGTSALQPRTVFVNAQGGFQSTGLAPGSYRIYAFDRTDGIEFTNPEAMKAYGSHAETVVLSAGQKAQVNVELTKVADQ